MTYFNSLADTLINSETENLISLRVEQNTMSFKLTNFTYYQSVKFIYGTINFLTHYKVYLI